MAADARIQARMEELIAEGDTLLRTRRNTTTGGAFVDHETSTEWKTKAHQILVLALGNESIHVQTFVNVERPEWNYYGAAERHSVLKAAHDDYVNGFITMRALVEAEVFDSILEQADELLGQGYKDAAAVMVGGVLEEHLRSMCVTRGIPIANPRGRRLTLSPLNDALRAANAYNVMKWRQVGSWGDLRNHAAHGDYGQYNAEDVAALLSDVRRFCADHA